MKSNREIGFFCRVFDHGFWSFGLAKPRPVVRDGSVVVRPTFTLTLNLDRRLMAGAQAARFFERIVELLENPKPLTGVGESPAPQATIGEAGE